MATTIPNTIIKSISQGENVFDETAASGEVFKWKNNISTWNPVTALTEGTTVAANTEFKANYDSDKAKIISNKSDLKGGINVETTIATTMALLKTQLGKLEPSASNDKLLVLGGKVYSRKFTGKLGASEFSHSSGGTTHVYDEAASKESSSSVVGLGSNDTAVILLDAHTVTVPKYHGKAGTSDTIAAGAVFYIETGSGFNNFEDAGSTAVKSGYYVNTSLSSINLSADYIKQNLNDGDVSVVGDSNAAADANAKAALTPSTDLSTLHGKSGITVVSGPIEALAQPTTGNEFWQAKPGLTEPLDSSGAVVNGAIFDIKTGATDTSDVNYWTKLSEGLVADIASSNTAFWEPFTPKQGTDVLKYRA